MFFLTWFVCCWFQHKREAFPRFFFLSNDELLELLSQAKNPSVLQPLIRKCFDNLYQLMLEDDTKLTEIAGNNKLLSTEAAVRQ